MHSQGDVKEHLAPKGVETFLDNYDDNFEQSDDFYDVNPGNVNEREEQEFKEFAKYLKPRVPSSIKIRQEKLANMKAQKSLEPKLKLSLDKLLNRLQKCENAESIEKVSIGCSHEDPQVKNEKGKDKREVKIDKVESFNYETLSRKFSPTNEDSEVFNSGKAKPVSKWFGPVEPEKSVKLLRPMDDQCALDLHKSKSYIVDLIDRALSKELGTVPRDQVVFENLTPNKAVATISRQQKFQHRNGVSYEVTAALTDSIISNASAPPNLDSNQLVERSRSQGEMKEKSGEDGYIKQLKQLRWGHIRHIQHEARRLADLEEFLEKCGEIEY
ncbi:hypothetical protein D910_07816 [Dendroctonus ponderosae]|uniref:Uncharacterized protein n=2 Tax=Dendroctonus ponderosae TaxID=77166 RepID=U4UBN3_DENPD|nr:hypothetical protein D910_07816 [Dendroctonus ponderosae]